MDDAKFQLINDTFFLVLFSLLSVGSFIAAFSNWGYWIILPFLVLIVIVLAKERKELLLSMEEEDYE